MKKLFLIFLGVISSFAIEPVVSTSWLSQHISDDNLLVIQVNDKETYIAEHIPYSLQTDIDAWRTQEGTYFKVRELGEIQKEIQRLSIDDKTDVVLYANVKMPKDLLKVSYIFWALNYHGIKNVAILDGGLQKWKKEQLVLQKGSIEVSKSAYEVKLNPLVLADKEYVLNHIGVVPMIDARPGDKYLGITQTDTVARNGHIKGAMSYTWNFSLNNDYTLKDIVELDILFRDGYDLYKNKEIVAYCTGGLEASYNYYLLKGVLGYNDVKLYDASMKEWGNMQGTPMTQYKYEMFVEKKTKAE